MPTDKDIDTELQAFWNAYCVAHPEAASQTMPGSFHFCDNQQDADTLASLVVAGEKRATCGMLQAYTFDQEAIPAPGQLSIVTFWDGRPACMIETLKIDIIPYDQVDEDFARAEGEGDKSLAYWRQAHWDYFTRTGQEIGITATLDMPLVCETFRVVHLPTPD